MTKFILSTLLFALVVSIGLVSCKKKPKEDPQPSTPAETNIVYINGTKYIYSNIVVSESSGRLTFSGTPDGASYPQFVLYFNGITKPTSTATYPGRLLVAYQNATSNPYYIDTDFQIKVNNGILSVSIPNTTLTDAFSQEIKVSAEISCK